MEKPNASRVTMQTDNNGNGSRPRRLSNLNDGDDQPLTTTELARMIGMSATFVRGEIRAGNLRAAVVGRGRKRVFRIPVQEARSYVLRIGFV